MPTIKTKKEMNLPELIEWITENNITYGQYMPKLAENTRFIAVNGYGEMRIYEFIRPDDVFTVEVEEEITEDTKLVLVSRCIGKLGNVSYMYDRTTINSRLKNLPKDCKITHIYIENEDKDLVLIWKNGEMIEGVF
ncbi:hypothetical protein NHYGZSKF_CDS0021 [Staphylococcus phage PG-2021_15]|nr:hypothetical protein [Mammaliicoccus phage vB_MscM-PMS3]WBF82100.1 hypothetical protein [Mammaliicoccus virus vB_MscM-PMS2]